MNIKEIIETIVDNGRVEDMHELSEILECLMENLEISDNELYQKYEMKLYEMAYGKRLSREYAEEIVRKMKPYRMKWSFEETRDLQNQYGINDIDEVEFFIVMNSAYNDYKDVLGDDIENYIRFTIDFIQDEDAKEGKVFIYFTTIAE